MLVLLPGTVSQTTFSLSQTPNFQETSLNLSVYIVILILVFILILLFATTGNVRLSIL